MNPLAIPEELRARRQWVVWRNEERGGKLTKVPRAAFDPSRPASSTDPATWSTFEEAVAASAEADGVGFVFSPDDPYTGVDLDACVDGEGELHPEAAAVVSELDSYAELSPSGTGAHVLVRAELNGSRRRTGTTGWGGGLELYNRARYFTITGAKLPDVPGAIEARQTEVEAVVAKFLPPAATNGARHVARAPVDVDDRELLERAFAGRNGHKIEALYRGDTSDHGGDHSAADQALANHLAFWCGGDAVRIDRLFRQSGLMRAKWEREDYAARTIEKALAGCTDFYEPRRPMKESRMSKAQPSPEGLKDQTSPHPAAEGIAEILDLASVGLTVTTARIVGRGGGASADIYLSDGSALTFERLRDVAKPGVLAVEVAACTGATPKLNGPMCLRVVSLLRDLAEHETVFDGDQVAREWGTSFLQEASPIDLDMADQAQRWAAFNQIASIDPIARRAAGEATSIASACVVLRHENGARYVRTGWFRAHVRAEESISSTELANRMSRVGWERRGQTGRIKAIRPDLPGELIWAFYTVPNGWEGNQ